MEITNMKLKLEEIVQIRSGHLFKSGFEKDNEGNVKVVQLKDVDENGRLNLESLYKAKLENLKDSSFLENGDILIKAKSNKPVAALVDKTYDNTIATNHFIILKINGNRVDPGYLHWYLNQETAQKYFTSVAGGTRVPILNIKVLGGLEVLIPDIDTQKKIVHIHELFQKEKELIEKILEKRKKLIDATLTAATMKDVTEVTKE